MTVIVRKSSASLSDEKLTLYGLTSRTNQPERPRAERINPWRSPSWSFLTYRIHFWRRWGLNIEQRQAADTTSLGCEFDCGCCRLHHPSPSSDTHPESWYSVSHHIRRLSQPRHCSEDGLRIAVFFCRKHKNCP